jgi:hypothetical protein
VARLEECLSLELLVKGDFKMTDSIQYEILEDGTISVTTDGISGTNHKSADELLEGLADLLGGPVKIKKRKGHVHVHRRSQSVAKH